MTTRSIAGRRSVIFEWFLVAAGPSLLGLVFAFGRTWDDEDFAFPILNCFLYVQRLLEGSSPWWISELGLGIPLAPAQMSFHHILLPLLAVMPPDLWARLLYGFHLLAGTLGMLLLLRRFRLSLPVCGVCLLTYILATPSLHYGVSDFWIILFIGWMTSPWILLATWGLLDSTVERETAFWSLSLAALTGLFVVNSNPTYTVTYFPVFAAVLIARWRDVYRNWHWWALAAILAAMIILPTLVYLLQEISRFAPTAVRYRYPEAPALTNILDLLVRPLTLPNEPWQEFAIRRGTRIVFFGGPFVLLCLYYLNGVWRRTTRLDLTLPIAVSVAILTIEAIPTPLVSARFQYRDPLILFAVLMAGSVLDDLWRSRPRMAASVAAVQCIIMISAAWPFIGKALQPESQIWDRRATGQTGLAQDLATLVGQDRIILSRDVDQAYTKKELLPEGLPYNSLAYRGVSLVNGIFKGSSTETVYPSPQLAYGWLHATGDISLSKPLLDVLGIKYVLAYPEEQHAIGLEPIAILRSSDHAYQLWRNDAAWPYAGFIPDSLATAELPLRTNCGNTRLMCRDFLSVSSEGSTKGIRTLRRGGNIDLSFEPASSARFLLVSEMFRPEWKAFADSRPLTVRPVFGALIGVEVPSNVQRVELRYRPTLFIVCLWMSRLVLIVSGLSVLLLYRRRKIAPITQTYLGCSR